MKFVARILLAVLPLLFLNGCLTKRTVTRDGYVVEDTYVFRASAEGGV